PATENEQIGAGTVALPAGAMTTSTVAVASEAKSADGCETPRSRGFASGSRIASRTATVRRYSIRAGSESAEVDGPDRAGVAEEAAGLVAAADVGEERVEHHPQVRRRPEPVAERPAGVGVAAHVPLDELAEAPAPGARAE